MFKEVITCALVLTSIIECSSIKREFKVYNGDCIRSWTDNPFKFIVLLAGQSACTGSIFNSKTVISAGHCFMDPLEVPTFAALESTNRLVTKQITIEQAFISTKYQTKYRKREVSGEDCAVVRLEKAIDFDKFAHNALTYLSSKVVIGTTVILVGYGADSCHNDGPGSLRRGQAVVSQCLAPTKDKRICVQTSKRFGNQIIESGDSGMPLLTEEKGEYFGHGICSGRLTFRNGVRETIFASYKKHETYIKSHAS